MKFVNTLKKHINNENLVVLMMAVVIVQPIFDIDYLLFPLLDKINVPLPSTFLYFIGLPLLIFFAFLIKEQNKKRTLIFAGIYIGLIGVYTIAHHFYVRDMFEQLYLTNRYIYSVSTEIRYILTLVIPFGLVYAFYRTELNTDSIKKIVIVSSALISVPIFLSNLFLFGPATYYDGPTLANFPTWFFGIYETHHPKSLTTKFFFSEGNTTGIILFSIYPLLIRQLFTEKRRLLVLSLIFIQGWAMYVLATRVATYGVPLMIAAVIFVYLFLVVLKKERFNWKPFVMLIVIFSIFFASLPLTPAVKNLEIDNRNDLAVFENDENRKEWKDEIDNIDLIPGTAEFNYYYQHIFEVYYWLLTIPDVYYKWYYPYVIDPKFYVDLIFEYEFWERKSGRQFQQIFFDYKWDKLDDTQKLFGFGYSRFMMGSILIEQDFVMQTYTLGYIGVALLNLPWIGVVLYMLYLALRRIKSACNFDLIVLAISIVSILGGAYLSGHVLDQFFSTTYLALFVGTALFQLVQLNKEV